MLILRKDKVIIKFLFISLFSIKLLSLELATIGTGGLSGLYYPTGSNICFMTNKHRNTVSTRCTAIPTAGSVYNINALKNKSIDFAMAQNDTVFSAYNGIGKFKNKPMKDLRFIFSVYSEPLTLVVSKKSNITSLNDLSNKNINISNKGSGTRVMVDLLIENDAFDLSTFKNKYEYNDKKAIQLLLNGQIDGFFITTGHPNVGIKDLALKMDIDLVNINTNSVPVLDDIYSQYKYYTQAIIQSGIYKNIIGERETFGVTAAFITSKYTSDKMVHTLMSFILSDLDHFKQLNLAYKNMSNETILNGFGNVPIHKAAIKYYKELGIIQPTIE